MPITSDCQEYYEVLQVSPHADQVAIHAAYSRLVDKWHADRRPGDTSAFERLTLLDEAFTVLSNPEKRKGYDARRRQATPTGEVKQEYPQTASSRPTAESSLASETKAEEAEKIQAAVEMSLLAADRRIVVPEKRKQPSESAVVKPTMARPSVHSDKNHKEKPRSHKGWVEPGWHWLVVIPLLMLILPAAQRVIHGPPYLTEIAVAVVFVLIADIVTRMFQKHSGEPNTVEPLNAEKETVPLASSTPRRSEAENWDAHQTKPTTETDVEKVSIPNPSDASPKVQRHQKTQSVVVPGTGGFGIFIVILGILAVIFLGVAIQVNLLSKITPRQPASNDSLVPSIDRALQSIGAKPKELPLTQDEMVPGVAQMLAAFGRPVWSDDSYSRESRLKDIADLHAKAGLSFDDAAPKIQMNLGIDPLSVRSQYRMAEETFKASRMDELLAIQLLRRVPAIRIVMNWGIETENRKAVDRIRQNKARDKDYAYVAQFKRLEDIRRKESTDEALWRTVSELPAMFAEFALGLCVIIRCWSIYRKSPPRRSQEL